MTPPVLSDDDIESFLRDGFVRVDEAFPEAVAAQCRDILWQAAGLDRDDATTWTVPVVRVDERGDPPFVEAANTPRLTQALDQIVGAGRWLPRTSLGSFPIRFPSETTPGDDGWHVEASFPGDDPADYMSYRVNLVSEGRALLMLFLFSDVGESDAPTRIRKGSHRVVARVLSQTDRAGLSFMELAGRLEPTEGCEQALATGRPGTVYLCHPFVVHAAQPHRGQNPRFMAQPPLHASERFRLDRAADDLSPVERAIRESIDDVPAWARCPT